MQMVIKKWRLISLLNLSYKTFSKVSAAILYIPPDLISLQQTAYVSKKFLTLEDSENLR